MQSGFDVCEDKLFFVEVSEALQEEQRLFLVLSRMLCWILSDGREDRGRQILQRQSHQPLQVTLAMCTTQFDLFFSTLCAFVSLRLGLYRGLQKVRQVERWRNGVLQIRANPNEFE